MQCTGFLEGYTDFRDGRLDPTLDAAFREHRDACSACAGYDRTIRDGLRLLAELPEAESSEDFMPRLTHRLYNVDQGVLDTASNRFLGSAALVAVASVGLLALFWLPFAASVPVELELPAVAVERPPEQLVTFENQMPSLLRPGPFVEPADRFDGRPQTSFLDGERQWYPAKQQAPRVFLTTDLH